MAGTRCSCCSMHGAKAGVCVAENANVAEERKCGKKNEKIKNKKIKPWQGHGVAAVACMGQKQVCAQQKMRT